MSLPCTTLFRSGAKGVAYGIEVVTVVGLYGCAEEGVVLFEGGFHGLGAPPPGHESRPQTARRPPPHSHTIQQRSRLQYRRRRLLRRIGRASCRAKTSISRSRVQCHSVKDST